jgi:hypothetical protein
LDDTCHSTDLRSVEKFQIKTLILIMKFLSTIAALCCAVSLAQVENRNVNVCESEDKKYSGVYLPGPELDGVATFSNENDYTFFRNKGYWYLGDLSVWPPITHYRCVFACPEGEDLPSSSADGDWIPNTKITPNPVPVISLGPCSISDEL